MTAKTTGSSDPAAGLPARPVTSPDPARSAAFYRAAVVWSIRDDQDSPAFEPGTGYGDERFVPLYVRDGGDSCPNDNRASCRHVIGHLLRVRGVVDETLDKVTAIGGTIIRPPFPEGDRWVAAVEDRAGNLVGVWQQGSRHG